MPKQLIILPLKDRKEFKNDSDYIKYSKKRYTQRCNFEYRERQKLIKYYII